MQFVVSLPEIERVGWMWALVFAFCVPELGTFIRSMRICFFKSSKRPQFSHLMLVTVMESFHTLGVALLVFVVLPEIDVVRGAMLTNCVCLVPGILGKILLVVISFYLWLYFRNALTEQQGAETLCQNHSRYFSHHCSSHGDDCLAVVCRWWSAKTVDYSRRCCVNFVRVVGKLRGQAVADRYGSLEISLLMRDILVDN